MVVPVGIEPTSPQLQSGANPFQLKNHVYTSCHSRHPVGCRNGVNRTPSAHALGPKPSAIPIGDIPFLGNTGERGKIPPLSPVAVEPRGIEPPTRTLQRSVAALVHATPYPPVRCSYELYVLVIRRSPGFVQDGGRRTPLGGY